MRIKNIIGRIKRLPKKVLITSAVVLGVLVPATAWAAWGPTRPVFDYNDPAQRVGSLTGPVFNSFINTPSYGDERNFTTASPAGTAQWRDGNVATPGQEMEVRVYIHNNANPSLNDAEHNYAGIARNTRVRVDVPSGMANGFDVTGYVSADNAAPQQVYDSTPLTNNSRAFSLSYVPGSARIYNNGPLAGGAQLSDDVVSANGAAIGYDALNGNLPGCFDYEAVVTIKVRVNVPELEITKQVTTPGSTDWRERIVARKGDTVSWLVTFNNTGDEVLNNLTIRDVMPDGVTLVPGTIMVFDPARPNGEVLNDTALGAGGVNVGNYAPGGGGYIRFRTTVDQDPPAECVATNVAYGRATNVPEQEANATVVIEDCQPVTPLYSCDSLGVESLGNRTYRFTANATATGGATIKQYMYTFGDGTTELSTDQRTVEHTYSQPGNFVAVLRVMVDVNGETRIAEGPQCTAPVNVEVPPVTPPVTPGVLPNTGAGEVIGIFVATTIAGMAAYRFVWARRYNV